MQQLHRDEPSGRLGRRCRGELLSRSPRRLFAPGVVVMFLNACSRVEHKGNLTYYSHAGNSFQTLTFAGSTRERAGLTAPGPQCMKRTIPYDGEMRPAGP